MSLTKGEDAKKEAAFHKWLCDESYQHLDKVKGHLWKIEVERAKRYGRLDPIAMKAAQVMGGVRKQIEGLTEISDKLEEEDPPESKEEGLHSNPIGPRRTDMTLSRAEISKIAQEAASKVLEGQTTCVSAGMTLFRDHDSFRKATPVIFRVNLKGLVSEDDLKVPHSELAMHVGAAGKDLIAFTLTGTQTGLATYDEGEGSCGFIFGREDELFKPPLVEKVNQMWEKRGPD